MRVPNSSLVRAGADLENAELLGADAQDQGAPENPLVRVHALLRGRYHWAVLIGIVLGAAGAAAGYKLTVPTYQSTGVIEIKPTLPQLTGGDPNVMPMYDAFLQSQVSVMQGERVINGALQTAEWAKVGGHITPEAFAAFSKSLEVTHPKGSELLVTTFTDRDPQVAQAAVAAVTAAYIPIYEESNSGAKQKAALTTHVQQLTNDIALNDGIILGIEPLGATVLQELYNQQAKDAAQIRSKLQEVELAIADSDTPAAPSAGSAATQPSQEVLSPEEIAHTDRMMAEYLKQLHDSERELDRAQRRWLPNHPNIKDAEASVTRARHDVDNYAQVVNQSLITGGRHAALAPSADGRGVDDLRTLKARRQKLAALLESAEKELGPLRMKMTRVNKLTAETERKRKEIEDAIAAIKAIDNAQSLGGRLVVLSPGDKPLAPTKDRRLTAAAGGGVGGMAAGFGLIMLLGLLDRRLKDTADAQLAVRRTSRLLGILPHLPEDLSDPEQSAMAAHCVHHIRGRLQIHHDAVGHRALAITSPSASDGKTTLVLALGLSFAASRSKTLLIDFDVVGGGLTARTNTIIRRRIGQVLLQQGLVEPAQLERALKVARESGAQLGDVLVKLGYVLPEELEAGLAVQQERTLGLLDALAGEPLEDCVAATGVPNLSVLPLGEAGPRDVAVLAPSAINGIISEARARFDTILIDTGPILGSLEASLVASQVDQVALVVSRGQRRPLVDRAIEVLTGAGAAVAGIVFNRAGMNDLLMMSSGSGSGEYRPSRPPLLEAAAPAHPGAPFGPLASAVISSTPRTAVKARVRPAPAAAEFGPQ